MNKMNGNGQQEKKLETEYLNKFAQDLTKLAEEGKLDPVIGRDDEM